MPEAVPVIAVDGTAGSGKGTLARNLANELGWHYLDSGALYRAAGLAVLQADTDPDDAVACGGIAQAMQVEIETRPESIRILLDGTDVTTRVRAPEVGRVASRVSVPSGSPPCPARSSACSTRMPGLVADGRDMGTVFFRTPA